MEENCRSLTQEQAVQIGLEMFGLLAARCVLLFKEHIASQDLGVKFLFITARKRSLGQGNIFIGVCQEFCSQGGSLPQCMLGCHPPEQTPPPWEQTPPGDYVPPRDYIPPQDYVPPGYYVPSWDYIPPQTTYPPGLRTPPDYVPPMHSLCAGGTHPTGMHSCLNMQKLYFRYNYLNFIHLKV